MAGVTNVSKAISSLDLHVYLALALEIWKETDDLLFFHVPVCQGER